MSKESVSEEECQTRKNQFKGRSRKDRWSTRETAWLASFVLLPYASYAGLLGMAYLLVTALFKRGEIVWRLCGHRGFGWLTAGLLLSASFGINRGDGFLQLANFLPFFVFFGVLATQPGAVRQPFVRLAAVSKWLLLTAIPLNAIAVVEYGLKFEQMAGRVQAMPLPKWFLGWLYEEPSFGHRAHSLFNHPNGLSAYLVMVLGLGLGLILKELAEKGWAEGTGSKLPETAFWLEAFAVVLCMAAIFCTGSRNGVLIVLVVVAIALYAARRHRGVWLSGLVGAGAIAAAILSFGIGGRSLSLNIFTQDPRLGVWHLAITMIQQRPWLGWGFSGLREIYQPGSIPGYDKIFHAHNVWLFLASEAGIPVMIGFCCVIGTLYYQGIRTFIKGGLPAGDRAILLGYLLAFSTCLMFGLFDVVLFDARNNILAWGLLAGIYLLSHSQVNSQVNHPVNHKPISQGEAANSQ